MWGWELLLLDSEWHPPSSFYAESRILICEEMEKTRHVAKHINDLIIERPLFVEIEPICLSSEIDDRMQMSKFTWAVTLLTYRGSLIMQQIVVEGLNDGYFSSKGPLFKRMKPISSIGEKFVHLSELNPPVRAGLLPQDELKFVTRTEIWVRNSSRVKEMINAGEEDITAFQWIF